MADKVTIPALHQMKREGRKCVGVVAWDCEIARIADRAGVDIVSVGDSVGVNLWGHSGPLEVTLDEMLVVCKAVRRGVARALVSCDFPFGPLQQGTDSALRAAIRLVKEGGADMIKLDGAAEFPDAVSALVRAGIPVFAQFGITPQTALQYGIPYGAQSAPTALVPPAVTTKLVAQAKLLEEAGASLIDFTNSGPVAGAAVVGAVAIPVLGGFGGGPWLDGRIRMAHAAIGYARKMDRLQDPDLRQRCQDQPRCLHRADRRRSRRPPDQGMIGTSGRGNMATATIDGIVTRYEVVGSGPPLLMYAPGGFNAVVETWSTLGDLCQHQAPRRTCRRDTPAFCSTGANAGVPGGRVERVTWGHYVAQGKGLLDHLGIARAHIMGGCMGCCPALAFAVAHPQATLSMVLIWPVGGARYRISSHQRFAEHLAFVQQNGLQAVCRTGRGTASRSAPILAAGHGLRSSRPIPPSPRSSPDRTSMGTS